MFVSSKSKQQCSFFHNQARDRYDFFVKTSPSHLITALMIRSQICSMSFRTSCPFLDRNLHNCFKLLEIATRLESNSTQRCTGKPFGSSRRLVNFFSCCRFVDTVVGEVHESIVQRIHIARVPIAKSISNI